MSRPGTILQLLHGDDDDGGLPEAEAPAEDPGSAGNGAIMTLSGGQMALPDQAKAALGHAWRAALRRSRDLSEREGGLVHGLFNAKPPSVAEQHAYSASRAWVPPGHDNGIAEKAGVIYHLLVGRPGVALGNTISALAARPLRFFLALLVIAVLLIVAAIAF
jgi:hypothetical protein